MAAKKTKKELSAFECVYEIVRAIPKGRLLTYGAISKMMSGRLSAAGVGWALNGLGKNNRGSYTSNNVPWQRVVNSRGGISTEPESDESDDFGRPIKLQQKLLQLEGILFDEDHTVDLSEYLWTPTQRQNNGRGSDSLL